MLTPLLPFIKTDLSLSNTQLGLLGSAYNLPYGIGQLPGGWLADRIGPRRLILVGVCGVAVAGLLVGLSPGFVLIAASLVLLGLAGGGYHPAASPLVSASVAEGSRGRALGLHQIGGTASFFLTPLIAAGLATALGWRGSFITVAIPTMLFGVVLYVILGRRGYRRGTTDEAATAAPTTVTQTRRLVTFTSLGVVLQVLTFSTLSFVPVFAVQDLGASEEAAASMLAVYHFAGLFAGPLGGYLSDRLGRVPVMLAVGLLAGPVMFLLTQVDFGWGLSLLLLAMGSCQYIGMPISEAYVISHTRPKNRSTILGFYYFASRGGPGIIMPVLGRLSDTFSFRVAFSAVAATILTATLISAFLLRGSRD